MSTEAAPAGPEPDPGPASRGHEPDARHDPHELLVRVLSMVFLIWLLGLLGSVAAVENLAPRTWEVVVALQVAVTVVLFVGLVVLRGLRRRDARAS